MEHYGVVVSESTIRRVCLKHAQAIHKNSQGMPQGLPKPIAPKSYVIAQMDGTMVPTVKSDSEQSDKRKGKSVQWQEAKVSLAHVHNSTELVFGATLLGSVDQAGKQLRACAKRVGFAADLRLHGLGDGAPWIARQFKQRFGAQGSYLLDFYHVCEYLHGAAQAQHDRGEEQQIWLDKQKQRLKGDGLPQLLSELRLNQEAKDVADADAPIRTCYRYLSERQDQLHYQEAIDIGLPIGSGEIESAHRYVVQQRLKKPGAWWNETNAEHMLALRVNRANKEWNSYWSTQYLYAA